MNKRNFDGRLRKKSNFHFRVKENNVEYFYPGSRTWRYLGEFIVDIQLSRLHLLFGHWDFYACKLLVNY